VESDVSIAQLVVALLINHHHLHLYRSTTPIHTHTQVIKDTLDGQMKVQMYGADMYCLVQSPKEYELSKHMHPPVVADTSDLVMSPMPGTLISYSVSEGDHVELGQELCIVEAMKMQNIVRAPREGYIRKLNVAQGAAMVTDQVIMEYGPETDDSIDNA
jgi:propionyl-CoA carboxylase alpha chain